MTPKTIVASVLGVALILSTSVLAAAAQRPQVAVTVQDLIQTNHRLEVVAGTEVLWRDPHFDRVWFPSGRKSPRVERAEVGFRTVFDKPGTYRGKFTIAGGGHQTGDVYPLIVTVSPQ